VTLILLGIALVLMVTITAGLVRIVIGPTPSDRMMAAQLLGTSGIGVLLLLAPVVAVPALIDVALVFALLAAIAITAFTRRRVVEEVAADEAETSDHRGRDQEIGQGNERMSKGATP
jgi:multicomponent Na+:H+ antiporter subunit F